MKCQHCEGLGATKIGVTVGPFRANNLSLSKDLILCEWCQDRFWTAIKYATATFQKPKETAAHVT